MGRAGCGKVVRRIYELPCALPCRTLCFDVVYLRYRVFSRPSCVVLHCAALHYSTLAIYRVLCGDVFYVVFDRSQVGRGRPWEGLDIGPDACGAGWGGQSSWL